jgi:hypothetical protein
VDAAAVVAVVVEADVEAGAREPAAVAHAVACPVGEAAVHTVVVVLADIAAVAAHLRCRDQRLVRRR